MYTGVTFLNLQHNFQTLEIVFGSNLQKLIFCALQLPKIELDKTEVREKDVHLANIYENQMFIMVILHPLASASSATTTTAAAASQTPSTDIHMYFVTKEGTSVTRTHILVMNFKLRRFSSSIIVIV